MPTHCCIFCPKAHNRLAQGSMLLHASGQAGSKEFHRTAIPVFMGRVSPVLDTCTQMGILEPDRNQEIVHRTVPVKSNSIYERTDEIKKLGVGIVICGAVSDAFFNLLKESDIRPGLRNYRRCRGGDRGVLQGDAGPGTIPDAGFLVASTIQGTFCTFTFFRHMHFVPACFLRSNQFFPSNQLIEIKTG